MDTLNSGYNIIDGYFSLLESLSANNKLELIARLSNSMKTSSTSEEKSWKKLFGALTLDKSADEFVEELRNDRDFSRKAVDL